MRRARPGTNRLCDEYLPVDRAGLLFSAEQSIGVKVLDGEAGGQLVCCRRSLIRRTLVESRGDTRVGAEGIAVREPGHPFGDGAVRVHGQERSARHAQHRRHQPTDAERRSTDVASVPQHLSELPELCAHARRVGLEVRDRVALGAGTRQGDGGHAGDHQHPDRDACHGDEQSRPEAAAAQLLHRDPGSSR